MVYIHSLNAVLDHPCVLNYEYGTTSVVVMQTCSTDVFPSLKTHPSCKIYEIKLYVKERKASLFYGVDTAYHMSWICKKGVLGNIFCVVTPFTILSSDQSIFQSFFQLGAVVIELSPWSPSS